MFFGPGVEGCPDCCDGQCTMNCGPVCTPPARRTSLDEARRHLPLMSEADLAELRDRVVREITRRDVKTAQPVAVEVVMGNVAPLQKRITELEAENARLLSDMRSIANGKCESTVEAELQRIDRIACDAITRSEP